MRRRAVVLLAVAGIALVAWGALALRAQERRARAEMMRKDALAIYKDGDAKTALAMLEQAVELAPRDARVVNARGVVKLGSGNLEGAHEDFDLAVAIDPTNVDARLNRAATRAQKGDLDGALEDDAAAVTIDPWCERAWCNLGVLHIRRGELKGAEDVLEHARALDPDDPRVHFHLGNVHLLNHDYAKAVYRLDCSIRLDPTDPLPWVNRGIARRELGKRDAAIADFEHFLQMAPNHERADEVRRWINDLNVR
jgi:Flp pilus assembly protein TadD